MLPHKEFSFLFLDLFSFPQSIKLKSFKRTTLVALYVHFKQQKKTLPKEENMKICIQPLILTRHDYDNKLQTKSRKIPMLPVMAFVGCSRMSRCYSDMRVSPS